jgi:hypothetical protein
MGVYRLDPRTHTVVIKDRLANLFLNISSSNDRTHGAHASCDSILLGHHIYHDNTVTTVVSQCSFDQVSVARGLPPRIPK